MSANSRFPEKNGTNESVPPPAEAVVTVKARFADVASQDYFTTCCVLAGVVPRCSVTSDAYVVNTVFIRKIYAVRFLLIRKISE